MSAPPDQPPPDAPKPVPPRADIPLPPTDVPQAENHVVQFTKRNVLPSLILLGAAGIGSVITLAFGVGKAANQIETAQTNINQQMQHMEERLVKRMDDRLDHVDHRLDRLENHAWPGGAPSLDGGIPDAQTNAEEWPDAPEVINRTRQAIWRAIPGARVTRRQSGNNWDLMVSLPDSSFRSVRLMPDGGVEWFDDHDHPTGSLLLMYRGGEGLQRDQ